jgi:hypothetical protein
MDRILGSIIAVVLGLLALATVAGGASYGYDWWTNSKIVTNISQMQSEARAQFMQGNNGYTNFTTANAAQLITNGVVPTKWVRGNAIQDDWGNAVTLTSAAGGTLGSISFGGGGSETVKNCSKVVSNLGDYVSVVVGGTTFTPQNQPDGVSAGAACQKSLAITVSFQ